MSLILHEQFETDLLGIFPFAREIGEGMNAGTTVLLRTESRLIFPDCWIGFVT
jgi:hypothetical protein